MVANFNFIALIITFGIFQLISATLTLERLDAIADLSALALKYFSQFPTDTRHDDPEDTEMSSFAWSVSDMWDEYESGLYVLSRFSNFVDERDESTGQFSLAARVIRTFADQSEARRSKSNLEFIKRDSSSGNQQKDNDEQMYLRERKEEADEKEKVTRLIQNRWTDMEKAIADIEAAGRNGHMSILKAMIRLGSNHDSLKFITPELKADLAIKFMSLPEMKLDPILAKWLLTMNTYREDQLKLVKCIESSLQLEKRRIGGGTKNGLIQMFTELEGILKNSEIVSIEKFYKSGKGVDGGSKVGDTNSNTPDPIDDVNLINSTLPSTNTSTIFANTDINPSTPQTKSKNKSNSYFEEMNDRENELDRAIAENKGDENYDSDGIYDDQEKASDAIGQLTALILVSLIIVTALGTYVFLRSRRARRNRTILMVNGALEQSSLP